MTGKYSQSYETIRVVSDILTILTCIPCCSLLSQHRVKRARRTLTQEPEQPLSVPRTPVRDISLRLPLSSVSFKPSASLLLNLPQEIRLQIYSYLLADRILHIDVKGPRTRSFSYIAHYAAEAPPRWTKPDAALTGLGLLQTCRATYADALPMLYNSNVFVQAGRLAVSPELDLFAAMLVPSHAAQIRRLVLKLDVRHLATCAIPQGPVCLSGGCRHYRLRQPSTYKQRVCALAKYASGLHGLCRLRVELLANTATDDRPCAQVEAALLAPFHELDWINEVVVQLPWPRPQELHSDDMYPFKVERSSCGPHYLQLYCECTI